MSTPKSVQTAAGAEISVDPNGSLLQLAVSEAREGGSRWRLITDLTAAEVAELHGYLGDWLELRAAADAVASAGERGLIVVAPGAVTVDTGDW